MEEFKNYNAWALLIGTASEHEIVATRNDAVDLFNVLLQNGKYLTTQIEIATKKNADKDGIFEKFNWLRENIDNESTVFIYFGGHGRPPVKDTCEDFHLLPYGYEDGKPETVISRKEFQGLLRNIIAKKVVLFLNCCHAGGASNRVLSLGGATTKNRSESLTSSGAGINHMLIDQEMIDQLDEGSGIAIISACQADEESLILEGEKNTLFGQKLIEALEGKGSGKDPLVRLRDVFSHLEKEIPAEARKNYEGRNQKPSKSSDQLTDFPLSINTWAERNRPKDIVYYVQALNTASQYTCIEIGEIGPSNDDSPPLSEVADAFREKANKLSLQYRIRTHGELLTDIKSELGNHLFKSLSSRTQQTIRDHLDPEGDEKVADLLIDFGTTDEAQSDNRLLLPWELMTIPKNHFGDGTAYTVKVADSCAVTRLVKASTTQKINSIQQFRVLLIDASDEQEFGSLFGEKFGKGTPHGKIFTVLRAEEDDFADYNTFISTVQNFKPTIIHYVGNISQHGERSKLNFLDQGNPNIPELNHQALSENQYKWLYEGSAYKRSPIPKIFIIQDWENGKSIQGGIADFERASLFFSECGVPLSCFLPYCPGVSASQYIDLVYRFGDNIGLDTLFDPNKTETRMRFSMSENIHELMKDFGKSSQFAPVVYQNTASPLLYELIQGDESTGAKSSQNAQTNTHLPNIGKVSDTESSPRAGQAIRETDRNRISQGEPGPTVGIGSGKGSGQINR